MAKLYFYYSTMNAGKSTTLLQSSFNYRERGMHTLLLTAAFDDRFGKGKVSSRIGLSQEADLYDQDMDILEHVTKRHREKHIDCVSGSSVTCATACRYRCCVTVFEPIFKASCFPAVKLYWLGRTYCKS